MHHCRPDDDNDFTLSLASASFQTGSESLEITSFGLVKQIVAAQRQTCAECSEYCSSESALEYHAVNERHKAYACLQPGCGQRFVYRILYDQHHREHIDGHKRVDEEHPLVCVECLVEFKSMAKLQEHGYDAQHSPFACSCGRNFARLDVLNRHLDSLGTDLPKFPCQFCKNHRGKNGFRRRDHLLQHVRGYHKFEAEEKIDGIMPNHRGKYQTPPVCHFVDCLHHRDDIFETLSREEQNRSKPFESQSEYTKHMKNAHDFTQYPCTVRGCSKTGAKGYAREKDLIKHRKKDHPEAGTYVPASRDTKITCLMCTRRVPNNGYWHRCRRS
ncbi:uncharacterized protein BDZ83DRAFT_152344 [Colletotrichum acutatum]|uniref:C2H2-type domain-containing protein n=1 Tax=Glomerella acutata TaxID=27357 RepID=A0AAD8UTF8_GLOAC|nr:uncharacterized protein BDZ83DRAFT_152344 [Colletotrichum acutatum]KAK1728165.1 hypothetical protein BDZ83DRAFT_152344 [Colletotrichum acutatum]